MIQLLPVILSAAKNRFIRKSIWLALSVLLVSSSSAEALEAKWVGAWPFGPALAMAKSDTTLFVAMGGGVAIYDVSRPRTPVRLSEIRTPDIVRQIAALPAEGSRTSATLYIAGQDSGFWVYDVGDPSNPVELGHQGTPEPDIGVAVAGDVAAINLGAAGVWVLDIRRPSHPALVGAVRFPGAARNLVLQESKCYIAAREIGLVIADLSDPAAPRILSTTATPAPAEDITVADHYGFVAAGKAGTLVLDVSLGAEPQVVTTIPANTAAHSLFVENNVLAVVEDRAVRFFDVSHPALPEEVSTYAAPGSESPSARISQVLLDGLFAYLLGEQTGVSVVDFSNSRKPVQVRNIASAGATTAIAGQGGTAYLAGDFPGIRVLDLSTVTDPKEVKMLPLPRSPAGVTAAKDLLFVPLYEEGLQIYDLTRPRAPKLLSLYQPQAAPGAPPDRITGVLATDSYAYVIAEPGRDSAPAGGPVAVRSAGSAANGMSALLTLDLSNPRTPALVSSVEFEGRAVSSQAMSLLDERLYVAAGAEGLHVFLLEDPAKPVEIGSYSAHAAVAVAAAGDFAYLAAGRDGFLILNVRDPEEITQAGYLDTLDCRGKPVRCVGSAHGLAISGNLVILANAEAGVRVAYISDPAHPRVIGPFPTADYASAVAVSGSIAYVADRAGGLRILQFSE